MDFGEASKRFTELHDAWAEAHVEAMEARGVCIAKFRSGEGPSIADLDRVEALEAKDEELRNAMDEFTGQFFGD